MSEKNEERLKFEIPKMNWDAFLKRFNKLTKKAQKTNSEIPSYRHIEDKDKVIGKDSLGEPIYHTYHVIEVSGARPRIQGYTFLASIDHSDSGNVIRTFDDETDVSEYYNVDRNCDHCGINRKRNSTFLVKRESDDKILQVGSSCLVDFLGHASPEYYARLSQFIQDIREENRDGPPRSGVSNDDKMMLTSFLKVCLAVIKKDGAYKSKARHDGGATTIQAFDFFQPPRGDGEARRNDKEEKEKIQKLMEDGDKEEVNAAIKYVKFINDSNTFEHNLKSIANMETVEPKHFGIGAFILQYYFNFKKAETEKQKKARELANKDNQYVGELKQRIVFKNLTLKDTKSFANAYGMTYFNIMEDERGNTIVIKGTKHFMSDMLGINPVGAHKYVNAQYDVKATITDHREYNGIKQTIVNRATIEEIHNIKQETTA